MDFFAGLCAGMMLGEHRPDALHHQFVGQGRDLSSAVSRQGADHRVGLFLDADLDFVVADVLGIVVHGSSTEEV